MKVIRHTDFVGVDHDKVCEVMEGDLTYIGDFDLQKFDRSLDFATVCSIYHNANPNREKDHKDYLVVFRVPDYNIATGELDMRLVVSGIDKEEIEKERYRSAIHCLDCDSVYFSQHRHHMTSCECKGAVAIDGGGSYTKITGGSNNNKSVVYDLLKNKVKEQDEESV